MNDFHGNNLALFLIGFVNLYAFIFGTRLVLFTQ